MPIVICLDDRNVAIRTRSSSNLFPFSIIRDPEYSNFSSNVKITVTDGRSNRYQGENPGQTDRLRNVSSCRRTNNVN